MGPGPELLLVLLGLTVAVVVATIAGGRIGRRVRADLDRRAERRAMAATEPTVPAGTPATGAAMRPSVGEPPVPPPAPTPAGARPSEPDPNRRAAEPDPEAWRRLAGLPPPVVTRASDPRSPAMRDRGGVPISDGAIGGPSAPDAGPAWPDRPLDRRVAAAPFVLGSTIPRATSTVPTAGSSPRPSPSPARQTAGAPPDPAGPGRTAATPGAPEQAPEPARDRRAGLLLTTAIAIGAIGVALAVMGGPSGDVLDATGRPDESGGSPSAGAQVAVPASPGPVITLGPVMPTASATGDGSTRGTGSGATPAGGATGGAGGGRGGGAAPTPAGTSEPRSLPTRVPVPTATPRATTAPTATPAPRPTPTPQPTPPPTPAPTPTPDPTPAPTAAPQPPTAAFTYSVTGLKVKLTNRSRDAASWVWTFGDGSSSTARNPSHTYAEGGTYTIRLVVTASTGQTDSVAHDVTVAP